MNKEATRTNGQHAKQQTQPNFEPAQLAPHSQEAEEAVLGSILVNQDAFYEVPFLTPQDFFILRHAWIFEAMQRLDSAKQPIEYLTLIEDLRSHGKLDDLGGAPYITYLVSNIATSIHAEAYGRIVQRSAIRRRLLTAAAEIARLAREEEADVDEVMAKADQALSNVTSPITVTDWHYLPQIAAEHFNHIEALYHNELPHDGIQSGLRDLDAKIRGFYKGRFYIIAGRPGMSKTWLMLQLALAAARQGKKVGIISLEMGREELMNRIASLISGVNSDIIQEADFDEHSWRKFVAAQNELSTLPIFIDDAGFITAQSLRRKAIALQCRHGLDMLAIDYLQLGSSEDKKASNYERVSEFSRTIKLLTKPDALNIPIIALAQLSRKVEERADKRPILPDLRESGQLEQDADAVMFVYRDSYYNENLPANQLNIAELIIAKNRHSGGRGRKGTGTVKLFYNTTDPRFENLKAEPIALE